MNTFILKVEVEHGRDPELCFYDYDNKEYLIEPDPSIPSKMDFKYEVVRADFVVVNNGVRHRFGFSNNALKALQPLLDCFKDMSATYSAENYQQKIQIKSYKDLVEQKQRVITDYGNAIAELRGSFWKRLYFLFNRKLPNGQL